MRNYESKVWVATAIILPTAEGGGQATVATKAKSAGSLQATPSSRLLNYSRHNSRSEQNLECQKLKGMVL